MAFAKAAVDPFARSWNPTDAMVNRVRVNWTVNLAV